MSLIQVEGQIPSSFGRAITTQAPAETDLDLIPLQPWLPNLGKEEQSQPLSLPLGEGKWVGVRASLSHDQLLKVQTKQTQLSCQILSDD